MNNWYQKSKGNQRGCWWKAFKHTQYIKMTLSFSICQYFWDLTRFCKTRITPLHSTCIPWIQDFESNKKKHPKIHYVPFPIFWHGWAEQGFWGVWGKPLVPRSYQSLANEALSNHRWQRWYQSQQPRTGCCCFDFPQGTPAIKYMCLRCAKLHVIHNALLTGC